MVALHLLPLGSLVAFMLLVVMFAKEPPGWLEPMRCWSPPSWDRLLGCGEGGVNLIHFVAHAGLYGMMLASIVASVSFLLGTLVGSMAALLQGYAERVVSRACDIIQSFPTFLLAISLLSIVQSPARIHLAFIFLLTEWVPFARLALTQTKVLRCAGFVEAAYALGLNHGQVMWRHLLPNMLSVLAVQWGSSAASVIIMESSLAFVGVGPRDGMALGVLLDQGIVSMLRAPHVLLVGSLTIFMTKISFLLAGQALDVHVRVFRSHA
ncbi:ABC transporter permease [Pajaroellobacter abortibovis]|uniref:ABC transporter permease n=1 Tax=Pajaroellobacter abortibovis TaxID=1882918 RepID=UPI001560666D|nr:ABC transporter permease subunit [Pajaroellobacter abortibovis]